MQRLSYAPKRASALLLAAVEGQNMRSSNDDGLEVAGHTQAESDFRSDNKAATCMVFDGPLNDQARPIRNGSIAVDSRLESSSR